MDVLVLIDKLDDLVHNAKPVPLTDQVRVDKEEIYDILDQMRATIPEEIKQARWIVKERQEMLAEAKREAERIVKEARERQERLVGEEEITKQAERAAEDIVEDARAREREIRLGAEDYADEILNTLEVNLSKFIAAVQRGRERLQGKDEPRRGQLATRASRPQESARDSSASSARHKLRVGATLAAAPACSSRARPDRIAALAARAAPLGRRRRRPATRARTRATPTARRSSTSAARSPSSEVAPAHQRARPRAARARDSARGTAWRSCAATTAASSRRRSPARSSAPALLLSEHLLRRARRSPRCCAREDPRRLIYDEEFAELSATAARGRKQFIAWRELGPRAARRARLARGSDRADAAATICARRRGRGRVVILTSGTTGTPKGASRHQPDSLEPAAALFSRIPLRARETTMIAAPMFHSWGYAHFTLGLPLVLDARAAPPLRPRGDARGDRRAPRRARWSSCR